MFGLLNNPLGCSPILLMRGGSYSKRLSRSTRIYRCYPDYRYSSGEMEHEVLLPDLLRAEVVVNAHATPQASLQFALRTRAQLFVTEIRLYASK
jgi:hypothetical protein